MIYFAQPTNGGPIRIGASNAMSERLRTMGTWLPGGIETIVEIDGYFLGEAILHKCFDPIRIERDWFRSCHAIWRFIIDLRDGQPDWIPTYQGDAPQYEYGDLLDEFGGLDATAKALGVNSIAVFNQSVKQTSRLGYGLASRVIFTRLLRSGALPDYISRLHSPPRSRRHLRPLSQP